MRSKRVMPTDPTEARIVVLTDGLLLQKMKGDPLLKQTACIIIDEVHEVNGNMVLILGLLVTVCQHISKLDTDV
jgi:HrpA-like RNA helicase